MIKIFSSRKKEGFTLIEMLIVILIIVILIAIAVPAVTGYRRDALRTQDEGGIETVRTALEAALIRSRPIDNTSDSRLDRHSSGNLDYEALRAYDGDEETEKFYNLIADYLGPNFQGNFWFEYTHSSGYNSTVKPHISSISYWRSDDATEDESIMFYNTNWSETRTPMYLSEVPESINTDSYDPK